MIVRTQLARPAERFAVLVASAIWSVACGLVVGAQNGLSFGVAIGILEALAAAVLAAAVFAGWRTVAGVAVFVGLVIVAAPAFCVSASAVGGGGPVSACASAIGLPPVVGVPLLVIGPVAAWMLVDRRERR